MFDISLLQRIGPLLAKQQWPGLYLHALLSYSYLRVLVTLLTFSLSLSLSRSLSFTSLFSIYALPLLQLFGVQYPLSFCAGMVLVQLGLHFSLKRHMDNSAGSVPPPTLSVVGSSLLPISWLLSSVVSRPRLLSPQDPTIMHSDVLRKWLANFYIGISINMSNLCLTGNWITQKLT